MDFYALLDVPPTADAAAIRDAAAREARTWRERAWQAGSRDEKLSAQARLAAVEEAERVLLDPAARRAYDLRVAWAPAAAPRPTAEPGPAEDPDLERLRLEAEIRDAESRKAFWQPFRWASYTAAVAFFLVMAGVGMRAFAPPLQPAPTRKPTAEGPIAAPPPLVVGGTAPSPAPSATSPPVPARPKRPPGMAVGPATYANDRWGFAIDYPADLLAPSAASADGARFASADGSVVLEARGGADPGAAAWEAGYTTAVPGREVTYRARGRSWWVLSGYERGRLFYERSNRAGGAVKGFRIEVPPGDRARYYDLIEDIARSFRSTR